ncbi:MAG: hypothetical protein IJB56_05615 [Alistipes sp.]|nr:hypothetical protein [Alistipes sp.]
MRKLITLYTMFTMLLTLASCGDTESPVTPPSQNPNDNPADETPGPLTESHTLVIFMQGNNGLADFMDSNLQRIITAYYDMPTELGRIIVFYDRGNYTRLTELYMDDGMAKQRLIEEYPTSQSTVDKEFIRGVLERVKQEAPAESYGLIMSSHGGGWVPADLYDVYLLGEDTRTSEPQISPLFYGQDDSDCMEIPDLVDALSDTYFRYIIFDACMMANVEGLYDLRDAAEYIIASPTEVLGAGFPYETFIPMLFEREDHRLADVCREYMEYYSDSSGTIALIDCSKMEALAEAMRGVYASAMGATLTISEVQAYDAFPYHLYFDLGDYAESVASGTTLERFNAALEDVVIFSGHTESFFTVTGPDDCYVPITRYSGLSCYILQDECPNTAAAWRETAWAKATMTAE